ncbi:MAG TPA: hypothetical protein VGM23_14575, partial [Armatimonadota bacterium]|jgi:hypothetical protein
MTTTRKAGTVFGGARRFAGENAPGDDWKRGSRHFIPCDSEVYSYLELPPKTPWKIIDRLARERYHAWGSTPSWHTSLSGFSRAAITWIADHGIYAEHAT